MNKKVLGVILLLAGLALAGVTYYLIIVMRAGIIPGAIAGAVAGGCLGGAFESFRSKKK